MGEDTGAPLDLDTTDIAVEFVELYWRQSRPFHANREVAVVLQQNTGRQASIISHIAEAQQSSGGSLYRLKQREPESWSALVARVKYVVQEMPLWKLQTVGNESLDFLYENIGRGSKVTLKPGVAYCLRTFYDLIRDLIEGAWIRFVQKLNADKLGAASDLGTFLFGEERGSLEAYRPILFDVQKGECLYCRKPLGSQKSQVDHFIPWSRYPADIGHNFVLAHDTCNNFKSDYLAAEDHLAAWAERNVVNQAELNERLVAAALPCDAIAAKQVARWVYQQTENAHGQVWVTARTLRRLQPTWADCFVA